MSLLFMCRTSALLLVLFCLSPASGMATPREGDAAYQQALANQAGPNVFFAMPSNSANQLSHSAHDAAHRPTTVSTVSALHHHLLDPRYSNIGPIASTFTNQRAHSSTPMIDSLPHLDIASVPRIKVDLQPAMKLAADWQLMKAELLKLKKISILLDSFENADILPVRGDMQLVRAFGQSGNYVKQNYAIECMPSSLYTTRVEPIYDAVQNASKKAKLGNYIRLPDYTMPVLPDYTCTIVKYKGKQSLLSEYIASMPSPLLHTKRRPNNVKSIIIAVYELHNLGYALPELHINDFVGGVCDHDSSEVYLSHYSHAIPIDEMGSAKRNPQRSFLVPSDVRYTPPEWYQPAAQPNQPMMQPGQGQESSATNFVAANRWSLGIIALEVLLGEDFVTNELMVDSHDQPPRPIITDPKSIAGLVLARMGELNLTPVQRKLISKILNLLDAQPSNRRFVFE